MEYFGDSYDIVKQNFLRWLRSFGEWTVHPMFTEAVSNNDKEAFSSLLGTSIMSGDILKNDSDRKTYFSEAINCDMNLFLDPNTGIKVNSNSSAKESYIILDELEDMVKKRPKKLTLVFDQSVARGSERKQLQQKLDLLYSKGIYGVAYVSHACFILLSCDKSLISSAYNTLLNESRLPPSRFILKDAA